MDWISDNFQIVVLILIGVGSLVKRYLEAKAAGKQARDGMPDDEGDIFDPGDDWQPQPQPSVPPPLVRQTPPPLTREAAHVHSREYEAEVIMKRQMEMQDRLRQIKESKATTSGGAAATSARVSAGQSRAKPILPPKAGLKNVLRDRREIRRAMVTREILGPPLGLR